MEKIICSSCGATMTPNTTQPFLTCEYCDTTVPNTYYNAESAKAAAEPTLDETCVAALIEMGRSEKLAEADETCFGTPLYIADTARAALEIPDQENVYLLFDRFSLLGSFKEGFALADSGLYYKHDDDAGHRSWESFITGAIACTEPSGLFQDGSLSIGSSMTFGVSGDADTRLARFVIDFHNHVYQKHTGEAAPASWTVRSAAAEAVQEDDGPSLGQTVLGAAATLLTGGALLSRTRTSANSRYPQLHTRPAAPHIVNRSTPQRPAPSAPVRPSTAKPLRKTHPQQQPQRPGMEHPGSMSRPDNRPGMSRPTGGRGMNDRGGMGRSGGPGGRGGMGGPGGRGRR